MYIDAELELMDDDAITTSAASTNIIDLQNVADRIGKPMKLIAAVTQAFTAAGAATLTITIQESVDAAFSSPITLVQTAAIAKADLGLGADLTDILPLLPRLKKRYIRAYFTVATGPFTAGKLDLSLGMDVQSNSAAAIAEQNALLP